MKSFQSEMSCFIASRFKARRATLTRFICLAALHLCCVAHARALDPEKSLRQYAHTTWQADTGLPGNRVLAITQTPDGYLRLGLYEGAARFDGVRFTSFEEGFDRVESVSYERVRAGRDGSLLCATSAGLLRYKGGELTRYTTAEGLVNDRLFDVIEDSQGRIWAGSFAGLSRLENGRFTTLTTRNGLADDFISCLLEDREGALWIGTRNGLNRLHKGKLETFTAAHGLAGNFVYAIHEDRQRGVIVSGERGVLSRFTGAGFEPLTRFGELPGDVVLSMHTDRDGNLWVGASGGLARINERGLTIFTAEDGLAGREVRAIYEDGEGNLWVGTDGGLNRFRDATFTTYGVPEGLAHDHAWAVTQSRTGDLWVGTEGGLSRLAPGGVVTNYTTRDGLPHAVVYAVMEDRAGNLWIGTRGGLARFDGTRFTSYTARDGLPEDKVYALLEDRAGNLWIGTHKGLSRLRDGRFMNYAAADGLPDNFVNAFYEDRAGAVWVATRNGLTRYLDGQFKNFTTRDGLSHNDVASIHEDASGALWFGTGGGGLNRLDKENRFTQFRARHGLLEDRVWRILEDREANLWLASTKGISRVSIKELNDFAAGDTARLAPVTFGKADGMRTAECDGGVGNPGWRTQDGKLWFVTPRGIVAVDPARVRLDTKAPRTLVEEVVVGDAHLDVRRAPFVVEQGASRIEFRYTALALAAPERVRFRYQLEGFDREWMEADARRTAYYTNLPPGDYRFRVIASDGTGAWHGGAANETRAANEMGAATLAFRIAPRFYQTNAFLVLCATLALIAAWGLNRLRARRIERRYALILGERNRIAREVHDTLAQGFVGVSTQLEVVAELITRAPDAASKHLDIARDLARESLGEARRAIVNLRSPALESHSLKEALANFAEQLTEGTSVACRVTARGSDTVIPDKIENSLLRIGREAIANAVRHAAATHVAVELRYEHGRVRLRVADDGRGFDPEAADSKKGGGYGLIGMRERTRELGGSLTVDSRPGAGTMIEVVVPTPSR